jgi:hypothetical protein
MFSPDNIFARNILAGGIAAKDILAKDLLTYGHLFWWISLPSLLALVACGYHPFVVLISALVLIGTNQSLRTLVPIGVD